MGKTESEALIILERAVTSGLRWESWEEVDEAFQSLPITPLENEEESDG